VPSTNNNKVLTYVPYLAQHTTLSFMAKVL